MSLRCSVVRRCLRACLHALGLRPVNLPEVIDARAGLAGGHRPDAGCLLVERRAIVRVTFPHRPDLRETEPRVTRFPDLESALRALCAERIGLAGRAAMPGPKRALELRRQGRWQEVLGASEQVEAPLRARLDRWLRGPRFRVMRLVLRVVTLA
jgi:hypothetical protein